MLPWLLALVARLLLASLRVCFVNLGDPTVGPPRIYAFLHGRQFGLLRIPRPRGMVVMVSHSRDGSLQAGVLGRLGFSIVRGSSSRGGAKALRETVRHLRSGLDGAFAVDGPRGPYGIVKPGVLSASRLSRTMIVPVTCVATSALVFRKAWDRYVLPLPFSRVMIVAGEGIPASQRPSAETLQQAIESLEGKAQRLRHETM